MENKLFGVDHGIICQQCNCVGAYGAGISGAISDKYPEVERDFREQFCQNKGKQFGTNRLIKIGAALYVANIYSQDKCGYPRNGEKFTNINYLVDNVVSLAKAYPTLPVYVPHSADLERDGIGCGLGGEKWSRVSKALQTQCLAHGVKNVFILDTIRGICMENILDFSVNDFLKRQNPIER